ncbi:cytosolic factor, phosphatidylinositol/phosphatidylcholine transfer protein [Balamuthia mandrillaris]
MEAPTMSEKEQQAVEELRQRVAYLSEQTTKDTALLLRYVRARSSVKDSEAILRNRESWRTEYKPECVLLKDFQKEWATGKCFIHKHDRMGRPCLIVKGGLHIPGNVPLEETVRMAVWNLEKLIRTLPPNVDQYVLIYDRTGFSRKNFDLAVIKAFSQLQEYYPERLHKSYVLFTNFLFSMLFKLVSPFLAETTLQKIQLFGSDISGLKEDFDEDCLLVEHGGTSKDLPDFNDCTEEEEVYEEGEDPDLEKLYLRELRKAALEERKDDSSSSSSSEGDDSEEADSDNTSNKNCPQEKKPKKERKKKKKKERKEKKSTSS